MIAKRKIEWNLIQNKIYRAYKFVVFVRVNPFDLKKKQ